MTPLDSKFGFAWRDMRVLNELGERSGKPDDARVAGRIAEILGERAADRRIETLQDRIHRLYAWSLIDKDKFANKIKRETGALLALQNGDGGWRHSRCRPGSERLYTDRSTRLDAAAHRPVSRPPLDLQGPAIPT